MGRERRRFFIDGPGITTIAFSKKDKENQRRGLEVIYFEAHSWVSSFKRDDGRIVYTVPKESIEALDSLGIKYLRVPPNRYD